MKQIVLIVCLCLLSVGSLAQNGQHTHSLVFPDSIGWSVLQENKELKFRVNDLRFQAYSPAARASGPADNFAALRHPALFIAPKRFE